MQHDGILNIPETQIKSCVLYPIKWNRLKIPKHHWNPNSTPSTVCPASWNASFENQNIPESPIPTVCPVSRNASFEGPKHSRNSKSTVTSSWRHASFQGPKHSRDSNPNVCSASQLVSFEAIKCCGVSIWFVLRTQTSSKPQFNNVSCIIKEFVLLTHTLPQPNSNGVFYITNFIVPGTFSLSTFKSIVLRLKRMISLSFSL